MTETSRQAPPSLSFALRRPALVVCLVLSAAVLAVYARSLGNGPVWEDRALVVDNANLRSFGGVWRILTEDLFAASSHGEPSSFYRPFAMLTFAMGNLIGGTSAAAARFGNIALHAANTVLLAALIRRMTRARWRTAGLVAIVWALAPVCSEPVLWISGRFDLLVVTFALLATLGARIEGRGGVAVALVSVAAGLFSKESFLGMVPILFVDDLLVVRRPVRAVWRKYVTVAVLAAAYLVVRRLIGIVSLGAVADIGARVMGESFLSLVGAFFRFLLWPNVLSPIRHYVAPGAAEMVLCAAAVLAMVAACGAWLARAPDDDRARTAVLGIGWFVIATLPSALIGPGQGAVGDRYAYLPMVGIFIALAAVAAEIESRPGGRATARVAGFAAAAICVSEACATVAREPDWRDEETMLRSELKKNPEQPVARYMLAAMVAERGDLRGADLLLERLDVGNYGAWRVWNAVCFVRLNQNRLPEAERACVASLASNGQNPRAWVNLAATYVRSHRWPAALAAAERAVAIKQTYAEPRYLAAWAAANMGDVARARKHLDRGLEIAPEHAGLRDLEQQMAGQ